MQDRKTDTMASIPVSIDATAKAKALLGSGPLPSGIKTWMKNQAKDLVARVLRNGTRLPVSLEIVRPADGILMVSIDRAGRGFHVQFYVED